MPNDQTAVDTAAETPPVVVAAAPDRSHVQAGFLFAAVGAILFSTKAVAIKFAYRDHVDAETLLALRMLLATPFYVVIGLYSLRDRHKAGRPLPGLRLVLS